MSALPPSLRSDACLTGLFYLGLGLTGGAVFMAVRPQLFAEDDPVQTLANLTGQEGLARVGIALELGSAIFQALTAVWFAKLFSHIDRHAASVVALFGMVNAIATLASSVMLRAALDTALGHSSADPAISHLFVLTSHHFWAAGAIFFGLWLIPMGWIVLKGRFGPRPLGWILILGGIGYVASVFIAVLAPHAGAWIGLLTIPPTIGEFWMIGLLFWKGLRRTSKYDQK